MKSKEKIILKVDMKFQEGKTKDQMLKERANNDKDK